MRSPNNTLKMVIRVGIGLFFIVSAVLKLLSLDSFELYVYSFDIVNFVWSGLLARVIIACEILAGLLLIIKVRYKEAWWLAMLMLAGFSMLLVYVIIFRNDSNCHCMGDLVEIKPSISLIKNLIAIALLLLVRTEDDYRFKGRKLALAGVFVAALVPPFALFPMDGVYNLFSKSDGLEYSETDFNALLADSTMQDVDIGHGNYIVGVISSSCGFCKTSCLKMSEIVSNNQLDSSRILYFVWGDSAAVLPFQRETRTEAFRYVRVNPFAAVRVVNGQFPTYLFVRDGAVEATADLRRLTEKAVCEHLK